MNVRDAYSVLEIPAGTSLAEIHAAYKRLVIVWHPDRFTANKELYVAAQKKLVVINEAYELLQDANARRAVDLPTELVDPEVRYFGNDPRLPCVGWLDWSGLPVVVRLNTSGLLVGVLNGNEVGISQEYKVETITALIEWHRIWKLEGHTYSTYVDNEPKVLSIACRDPAGLVSEVRMKLHFRNAYYKTLFVNTAVALFDFNPNKLVTPKPPTAAPPPPPPPHLKPTAGTTSLPITDSTAERPLALSRTAANQPRALRDIMIGGVLVCFVCAIVVAVLLASTPKRPQHVDETVATTRNVKEEISPQETAGNSTPKQLQQSEDAAATAPPVKEEIPPRVAAGDSTSPQIDNRESGPSNATSQPSMPTLHSAAEYNARARDWHKEGQYDKAIADFTMVLSFSPRDSTALTNRGFSYFQKGEYEKALQDYRAARIHNPQNAFNLNNLA
ncbi:MAG: DnaJ domain-containing protein [Planctomycetaceae bacterium]|nr:DnaJ domain-containing protein [Planctomycetaceae bacterium]